MLSRGKLVQDWRRRLAAAEADGAEGERRTWLAQMRLRLYRFLLSCYQDADWRADEPAVMNDETVSDMAHGNTTTLLNVCLDGKPAKTVGKMQAVLKSVSAAQDHPAVAGPLLGGIAAEDWVVAVSARDELKMAGCQEVLKQFGIVSKWTVEGEIRVRQFDLGRAIRVIQDCRESLTYRPKPYHDISTIFEGRFKHGEPPTWPVRFLFVCVFLAPLYALVGLLLLQCGFAMLATTSRPMRLQSAEEVSCAIVIFYFVGMQLALLTMLIMDWRRRNEQREEAKSTAERAKESISPSIESETTIAKY